MIRVIIADDHDLIREGFKRLIAREADICLVGEAKSGDGLFHLLEKVKCDVLVLDISLPDKNGLDVLAELRTRDSRTAVIILSMHPEEHYALRALQSGAAGYITKGSASRDLVRAIRKADCGGRYVSESLGEKLALYLAEGIRTAPHEKLSRREFQVLLFLGAGKSVKEISAELALSPNTVQTYRRRILEKMDLGSSAQLIEYVVRSGLTD
jgi:two-component system invasion response regulator UvrY